MNIRTSTDTRSAARQALSNNWSNAVLVTLLTMAIAGAAGFVYYFISIILSFIVRANTIMGINAFGSFFYQNSDFFDIVTTNPDMEKVLSGFGTTTVIALAIISIIIFIISYLFLLAVSANLSVGAARYYLNLVSSNNAKISDLFFSFKYCPFKSLWVTLLVSLKTLLWGIVPLIPAGISFGLATYFLSGGYPVYIGAILSFCAVAFYTLFIILIIYASYRYCLAFFLLARNPTLKTSEVVKLAVQTINGHKADRFILNISFIGWWLLLVLVSIVTCGIGAIVGELFLMPYISASQAVQFCDITGTPTVRHDFVNIPYQAYQGFQSNPYNNQDYSQTNSDNTQNTQTQNDTSQGNEDIKDDSGENNTQE